MEDWLKWDGRADTSREKARTKTADQVSYVSSMLNIEVVCLTNGSCDTAHSSSMFTMVMMVVVC